MMALRNDKTFLKLLLSAFATEGSYEKAYDKVAFLLVQVKTGKYDFPPAKKIMSEVNPELVDSIIQGLSDSVKVHGVNEAAEILEETLLKVLLNLEGGSKEELYAELNHKLALAKVFGEGINISLSREESEKYGL